MDKRHMGDLKCLYAPCQEPDSLKHVQECEFYTTKFIEKEGGTKDWANYLVNLHQERVRNFRQPLISFEGWSKDINE